MAQVLAIPEIPLGDTSLESWSTWLVQMQSVGAPDSEDDTESQDKGWTSIQKVIDAYRHSQKPPADPIWERNRKAHQEERNLLVAGESKNAAAPSAYPIEKLSDPTPSVSSPADPPTGGDTDDFDVEALPDDVDASDTWEPDVYQIPVDEMRQNIVRYVARAGDAITGWQAWYEVRRPLARHHGTMLMSRQKCGKRWLCPKCVQYYKHIPKAVKHDHANLPHLQRHL